MKKKLFGVLMLMTTLVMALASCSSNDDSEPETPKLDAPQIVQHEQTSENPITLAFSWSAIGGGKFLCL